MAENDDTAPTAVSYRGRTTLFKGPFPVATVSRKGRLSVRQRGSAPRWDRVNTVHYIEGGTLTRVCVTNTLSDGVVDAVYRELAPATVKAQCDDCMRGHRRRNKHCSATLGLTTAACKPGELYHWGSKKSAGKWLKSNIFLRGRVRVGTARYTRS